MKEELVSYETAKLAKEKGFKLGSRKSYVSYKKSYNYDEDPNHRESYKKGDVSLDYDFYMVNGEKKLGDLSNNVYDLYEAPTQSLLQKWLREIHNIHVTVYKEEEIKYSCTVGKDETSLDHIIIGENYKTYEEALEVGLFEGLKLIK